MKYLPLTKYKPNPSTSSSRKRGAQRNKIPAYARMTLDCSEYLVFSSADGHLIRSFLF
jgi:hypothetical protein